MNSLQGIDTKASRFAPLTGGGGGELANLFVQMSLAILTSRREKRASLSSFRKWRSRHLQIQLFQAGFPTYSSFKVFYVWTEKFGCDVSCCRGK